MSSNNIRHSVMWRRLVR